MGAFRFRRSLVPTAAILSTAAIIAACLGDSPDLSSADKNADASLPDGASPSTDGAGACGDTQTSELHCGACGHACKEGVGCFEGKCGNEVINLGAGAYTSCAVVASGRVYCWGDNREGQLGDPSRESHSTPYRIPTDDITNAFDKVVEVAPGTDHTCARKRDGTIWCWGSAAARQYQGGGSLRPTRMLNIAGCKSLRAGGHFSCVIDGANLVQCW